MTTSIRNRPVWWVGVVLLLILVVLGIKHGRHYVVVDNFGVTEEGLLYRSGQLKPYQLENLIQKYGLKTVINTRETDAPEALMSAEGEVCGRNGVEMIRLSMPGDGRGTYAQYEQALAVLSDTNRLPALVLRVSFRRKSSVCPVDYSPMSPNKLHLFRKNERTPSM